jgi:hypothetical protein
MDWIADYHALMRGALAARAATGDAAAVAAIASAAAGMAVGEGFVRDVLAPPQGRMSVVIFRALAARFAVPASTIAAALFPVRRPSPYAL